MGLFAPSGIFIKLKFLFLGEQDFKKKKVVVLQVVLVKCDIHHGCFTAVVCTDGDQILDKTNQTSPKGDHKQQC